MKLTFEQVAIIVTIIVPLWVGVFYLGAQDTKMDEMATSFSLLEERMHTTKEDYTATKAVVLTHESRLLHLERTLYNEKYDSKVTP